MYQSIQHFKSQTPPVGDLGRAAIEGVAAVPVSQEYPEVGVILFNMGAVDKDAYSFISNMKEEVRRGERGRTTL